MDRGTVRHGEAVARPMQFRAFKNNQRLTASGLLIIFHVIDAPLGPCLSVHLLKAAGACGKEVGAGEWKVKKAPDARTTIQTIQHPQALSPTNHLPG